jgi:hypothetical protein
MLVVRLHHFSECALAKEFDYGVWTLTSVLSRQSEQSPTYIDLSTACRGSQCSGHRRRRTCRVVHSSTAKDSVNN